jgi:hypothetical protein
MQCDPGFTTDSRAGSREMHTFRKLPNSSPTPNPINSNHIAAVTPEVYVRTFSLPLAPEKKSITSLDGTRFSLLPIADS